MFKLFYRVLMERFCCRLNEMSDNLHCKNATNTNIRILLISVATIKIKTIRHQAVLLKPRVTMIMKIL